MFNIRLIISILIVAAIFIPFVPFDPLEVLIGAVLGLGAILLSNFISGVRPEQLPEGTAFNPKEWPKYLSVGLIEAIGYYFYHNLGHFEKGSIPYLSGLAYIVLVAVVPGIILFILLIRNRNDRIVLTAKELQWKDNDQHGEIALDQIASVTAVPASIWFIIPGHHIMIVLSDNRQIIIPVYRMNFTWRDTQTSANAIQSAISK